MQCRRYIEDYIPPFELIWNNVKHGDKWSDRYDQEYEDTCRNEGVNPCEDSDVTMEIARRAFDFVKETAQESYFYITGVIKGIFEKSDYTNVYRSIMVPDIDVFIENLRKKGKTYYKKAWQGVGIYWTWEKDKAETYWGGMGDYEIVLEARVSCEDVDVEGTVEAFLQFSEGFEDITEEDEDEIRLKPGRKIHLVAIHIDEDDETLAERYPSKIDMNIPVWT